MSAEQTLDSLGTKANAAFRQAAWSVIERARQTGTPVILWEDGRVVERSPVDVEERLRQMEKGDRVQRIEDASLPT